MNHHHHEYISIAHLIPRMQLKEKVKPPLPVDGLVLLKQAAGYVGVAGEQGLVQEDLQALLQNTALL